MKKFTHSLRGIATAFCLMAVSLAFADNITVDGINYTTKTDGTATVAKYTASAPYSGDIVISEKISYEGVEYTVVATAANSFVDCTELTSLVLPNTCVTIGRNCFKGDKKLKSITLNKTTKLTAAGIKKSLAGSKIKTVKVAKKKVKVYKKIFTKKVCGRKVAVTK